MPRDIAFIDMRFTFRAECFSTGLHGRGDDGGPQIEVGSWRRRIVNIVQVRGELRLRYAQPAANE